MIQRMSCSAPARRYKAGCDNSARRIEIEFHHTIAQARQIVAAVTDQGGRTPPICGDSIRRRSAGMTDRPTTYRPDW